MGKVEDLNKNIIVKRDYQAYFSAAKYVTYLEGSATSVTVDLVVERGNVVT